MVFALALLSSDLFLCRWLYQTQPDPLRLDPTPRKIPAHGGAVTCVESAGPAQAPGRNGKASAELFNGFLGGF